MDVFNEAIHDKNAKFNRFSRDGIQHLVVTTTKTQMDIVAVPTF